MGLQTDTDVESIKRVKDKNGNEQPAANETRQETANTRLTTIRDKINSLLTLHQNKTALNSAEYTTGGTTAEQLAAGAVPDGATVLVTPLRGNAGDVYLGDSTNQPITLSGGQSFEAQVTDTSAIYIRTPNAGDGVGVTWEQ